MTAVIEYFKGNGNFLWIMNEFFKLGVAGKYIEVPQIL